MLCQCGALAAIDGESVSTRNRDGTTSIRDWERPLVAGIDKYEERIITEVKKRLYAKSIRAEIRCQERNMELDTGHDQLR